MANKCSVFDFAPAAAAWTLFSVLIAAATGCGPGTVEGREFATEAPSTTENAARKAGKTPNNAKPDREVETRNSVRTPVPLGKLREPLRFQVQRLSLAGAAAAYANDVNDDGVVVGQRPHPMLGQVAAAWRDGKLLDLGRLNSLRSEAFSISNAGAIVGWCRRANETPHPFVLRDGVLIEGPLLDGFSEASFFGVATTGMAAGTATQLQNASAAVLWTGQSAWNDESLARIPTPGVESAAHGMNAKGQVVGEVTMKTGETNGFVWSKGEAVKLLPGTEGRTAKAYGISNDGVVVGGAYSSEHEFSAAFWRGGRLTTLPGLEVGAKSWAFDVNNDEWIVGWSLENSASNQQVAVLWRDGSPIDLNTCCELGDSLILAKGVNRSGQIVAVARGKEGFNYPVLLTPERSPTRGEKRESARLAADPVSRIEGVWIVDWVQTAELLKGEERKERMMLSYMIPGNKILFVNRGRDVRGYHCPLYAAPTKETWNWNPIAGDQGEVSFGETLKLRPIDNDSILVSEAGERLVYVRDRFAATAGEVELDHDAIADFLESKPNRMIRLAEQYRWDRLTAESREYLEECVQRMEQQVRELENGQDASKLLPQLRWRAEWTRKTCLTRGRTK